jgi:cytochrome c oxidase cbb3-type subunit 3
MIDRRWLVSAATAACGLAAALAPALWAAGEPDDDEAAHQAAIARQAVRDNCLICHSEQMVVNQRLTPPQWKAEVEKMVGWGAPVPREHVQPLIAYLAREYGAHAPPAPLERMSYDEATRLGPPPATAAVLARGDAGRGGALFAKNCAACHGTKAQGADLGQNLVERPVLLQPDAFDRAIEHGLRRMPAFQATLSREQRDDIRAWLQQRRFTPVPAR